MSEQPRPSTRIVPAEQARDLPRWTPTAFGDGVSAELWLRPRTEAERRTERQRLAAGEQEQASQAVHAPQSAEPPPPPPPPPPPAVDPDEVERIKTAAFDEGYAAGYDQGGKAARAEAEQLQRLAEAAGSVFARFEEALAPRIMALSIAVARQVIRRELRTDPDLINDVVRQAFDRMTGGETGRQLLLHPADAQRVRAHLGDELRLGHWKIVEDARQAEGGCQIHSSQSQIDASLDTRWQRVVASLGRDDGLEETP